MKEASLRTPPFLAPPGSTLTISAYARAEEEGQELVIALSPSLNAKKKAAPPFGTDGAKDIGWRKPLSTRWQRVVWEIPIPEAGWKWPAAGVGWLWDRQTWVLFLRAGKGDVWVDGVSLTTDGTGAAGYVPYSLVEAAVSAPSLPGYEVNANLLDCGDAVPLVATVSNASPESMDLTVHWELLNYDGTITFERAEDRVRVEPETSARVEHTTVLTGVGLLLARAIVRHEGNEVARSDLPLTALPFPKMATRPDPRERIGATPVIGQREAPHLLAAAQRIGLAWSRWYPYVAWKNVQKDGPDQFDWTWPDQALDALEAHGIANNVVLYGCPAWARVEGSRYIPKDMADWGPEDPRWQDLSVQTHWDNYLKAFVERYGRGKRALVYELVNEPEYTGGVFEGGGEQGGPGHRQWERLFYRNFVARSYQRLRKLDPDAVILISGVNNAVDTVTKRLLQDGGGPFFDVYSFHNYSLTRFSSPASIRKMSEQLLAGQAKPGVKLWFNEGWTVFPSSQDWPAQMLHASRTGADVADVSVRSMAECFAAGLDKFIAFNAAYPGFGKSWWDWAGDGTAWYDDDTFPTVAPAMFNVLIHHLGRSRHAASFAKDGADLHVFHDERNNKGVAVISWPAADENKPWGGGRGPGGSAYFKIPALLVSDIMGNAVEPERSPEGSRVIFSRGGQPFYLSVDGLDGEQLAALLQQ